MVDDEGWDGGGGVYGVVVWGGLFVFEEVDGDGGVGDGFEVEGDA